MATGYILRKCRVYLFCALAVACIGSSLKAQEANQGQPVESETEQTALEPVGSEQSEDAGPVEPLLPWRETNLQKNEILPAAPVQNDKVDKGESELALMEKALGRPLVREYKNYQNTISYKGISFVDLQYSRASRKYSQGMYLSILATPFIAGLGFGLYKYFGSKDTTWESGGVTTYVAYDKLSYVCLAVGIAGGLTTLIIGSIRAAKGRRDMKKIEPYLKPTPPP